MARLSAGERLMTRIRREIMAHSLSGRCRCTDPAVAGSCRPGSGPSDTASFCERNESVLACAEVTASSTVSELGSVRPPDPFVPDRDGLVLETSITWMSAMESSVHGTGSEAEAALLLETFVTLA